MDQIFLLTQQSNLVDDMSTQSSNLAIIFTSFDVKGSGRFKARRIERYKVSIKSIIRNLPPETIKILVDNTGFILKNPNLLREISETGRHFYAHSYDGNAGVENKGLGELDMLDRASGVFDLHRFEKVLYLTGRYFYTNSYAFDQALRSEANFIYTKPEFFGLDGRWTRDGGEEMLNDMFFCGDPKFILGYIDFYRENRSRMKNDLIPSERLLWEYFKRRENELDFCSLKLKSLGIIRTTTNREIGLDELQIL